jgi:transglutaminase-like putative cysteine protease
VTVTEHRRPAAGPPASGAEAPTRSDGRATPQPGHPAASNRRARSGRGLGSTALAEAALVVVMATLAGLAFRPVFAPEPLLAPAFAAALGAVAVSTLATRLARWPASAAALASIVAGPLVVAVVVWRAAPTPGAWVEAVRAVPAAPSAILSAPLPAPDRPELLALVAATAWVVGHVGSELAGRTRAPLAPLLPVPVALAVPLLLGVGGPRPGPLVVGGLAVFGAALAMVRASAVPTSSVPTASPGPATVATSTRAASPDTGGRPPGGAGASVGAMVAGHQVMAGPGARRARRRRAVLAVVMVAVAGLVPAVAGEALPFARDEARVDPRGRVADTPPDLRSPLVEVSAQRHAPVVEEAFTATGPTGIELWRTAVLDEYDGVTWRSSGVYEPVGSRLPDSGAPGDGQPAPVDVTVRGLDSPFVPVPGRPVQVEGVEARFDTATGTLLADEAMVDGDRYRVETAVGVPSEDELDLAVRDRSGADAAVARRPVRNAGSLASIAAEQVTTRTAGLEGTADIRQLRALQDFFADQGRFRLATEPVGGLSLRHLTAFVGTAVAGGVSEGSIEQFAAAYAVMARTLGYPTRVAVGYRTPEPPAGGTYHVENHDAYAWAEVKLDGVGWVPLVAAPVSTAESPPPRPETAPVTTTTAPPTPSSLPDAPRDTGESRAPVRPEGEDGGPPLLAIVVAGTLLTVACAALVGAPAVRSRRRDRRRRGSPAAQVDGAWRELVDGLAAYRFPVTRAMTAPEVVAAASGHAGAPVPAALTALARTANDARYGPGAPVPGAADEAWRRAGEALAWARGGLGRRARARAFFDVGAALRGAP